MTASLDEQFDVLGRLETKHVQCFLSILSHSNMRRRQFIEASYGEQARYFQETLQFLKSIKWVREQHGELFLTSDGESAGCQAQSDAEIRKKLTEAMIEEESPYQELLVDYLAQFKMADSDLVHRPPISDRLQESRLRNFLMDIGLVTYRADDDLYLLEEAGVELYVWATNHRRTTSRKRFETHAQQKEELGSRAELAVFEHEKKRVGTEWAYRVEHVSADSPFACYDIKSMTLQESKAVPRYIEVKAVPTDSYQFYWTASEVETAQLLRTKYFLYLLPVAQGGFDLQRMLIVQDPFVSVCQDSQAWLIEENVIVCRQKRKQ